MAQTSREWHSKETDLIFALLHEDRETLERAGLAARFGGPTGLREYVSWYLHEALDRVDWPDLAVEVA